MWEWQSQWSWWQSLWVRGNRDMGSRQLLSLCLLAGLPISCGPDDDGSGARVVQCDEHVEELTALPPAVQVVAGSVGFPVDDDGLKSSSTDVTQEGERFAKFGLLVQSDTAPTVEVANEGRDDVLIEWGDRASASTKVSFTACTDQQTWFAYPGGVYLRSPICLDLKISAGSDVELHTIAVDMECAEGL